MRNLTHRLPKSGQFFPNLGHSFAIFEKGQADLPRAGKAFLNKSNSIKISSITHKRKAQQRVNFGISFSKIDLQQYFE